MTEKLKHWSGSWQAEIYKMVVGTLILIILSMIGFTWMQAVSTLDRTTAIAHKNTNNGISMCKDIETNRVGIKDNRVDIDELKYGVRE